MKAREIRRSLREGAPSLLDSIHSSGSLVAEGDETAWNRFCIRRYGARTARSEHAFMDLSDVSPALDLPPVVRIPCPDPFEACKALDGGAAGIIAPYIETPEQVRPNGGRELDFRPLKGSRLSAALADDQKLERTLQDYLDCRNADTILILNIESVSGDLNVLHENS